LRGGRGRGTRGAGAAAAEQFLRAPFDDRAVTAMLERLGRAAAASRAYLFVHRRGPGGDGVADLRDEWVDDGVESQLGKPELQGWSYEASGNAWLLARFAAGESFAGTPADFAGETRDLLERQGVVSLVNTPVLTHERLWGFLGFDECRHAREWTESEIAALRVAASVLAAAVERSSAERELSEGEERSRDLIENASDLVWVLDLEGRLTTVNRATEELLERPRTELLGRNWREVLPLDQHEAVVEAGGRGERGTVAFELRIDRPSGEPAWLEVRSRAIRRDGRRVGFQGTGRDVTERRRYETRLRQAVRMEAWGRLAAGIARDFDALMTTIRGFGERALGRLRSGDSALREEVSEMLLAAERAAELIRELVAVGRQQSVQPVRLEVADWLEHRLPMLRRIAGAEIEVTLSAALPPGRVEADAELLEQALTTLVLAAREALPDGGRIGIDSRVVAGAEVQRHGIGEAVAAAYMRLSVRDSGPGLDPGAAERLFEPYSADRDASRGRGLGLSAVYGIVRQCEGFVFAESAPGAGTTFHLYLPLVVPGIEPAAAPLAAPAPAATPSPTAESAARTVLLVEDEDLIRHLAEQILFEAGYRVLSAANASEATAIAAAMAEPIDLLLTDIVMPGSSGSDLAQRLLRQHPEMRVLYMSGYSDSLIFRYGMLEERSAFLQKPFSADVLERRVGELLAGDRGRPPLAGPG
jgi:PAS domain S-box-containing protein